MTISRRTFVSWAAAGLGAGAVGRFAGAADAPIRPDRAAGNLILGGGTFIDPREPGIRKHNLSAVNLVSREIRLTAMDFLAHGIAFDPLLADRVVVTQKIGPGACEIDLARQLVTRTIPPVSGRWFYGHGVFSPDGKLFYSTETIRDAQRGVIGVRDGRSLQVLGEFPTFGENPHDCHLIDGGRVMLITNGGGPSGTNMQPCVTFVEVGSQKLLEKLPIDGERFNAGHVVMSSRRELVVVSAPRKNLPDDALGAVSIRLRAGRLRTVTDPVDVASRMKGEALSAAIHEPTSIAAVTHPGAAMLTFWSMNTSKLLKVLELPHARGVTLTADGKNFLVTYGQSADIVAVSPATLTQITSSHLSRTFITGSHIFNWNRLAARA